MGFAMFDIDNVKVGDIAATPTGRQMFYIHNIMGESAIMSGFGVDEEEMLDCVFEKDCRWIASRILSDNENINFLNTLRDLD